jgi:hypothetical protein
MADHGLLLALSAVFFALEINITDYPLAVNTYNRNISDSLKALIYKMNCESTPKRTILSKAP